MKLLFPLAAATLLVAPFSVRAQQAVAARSEGPTTTASAPQAARSTVSEADAFRLMESALRNLVTAQEKYWMAHGSYTTDMAALGLFTPGMRSPRDSAFAQVILAGSTGWTGMARHAAVRGKTCVIAINGGQLPAVKTAKQEKTPQNDGVPVCDDADVK